MGAGADWVSSPLGEGIGIKAGERNPWVRLLLMPINGGGGHVSESEGLGFPDFPGDDFLGERFWISERGILMKKFKFRVRVQKYPVIIKFE